MIGVAAILFICFVTLADARRVVKHDDSLWRIAVHLHDDADADALAAQLGMDNLGQIGALEHHYVFQSLPRQRKRELGIALTADDDDDSTHNATLSTHRHVRWFERQRRRQLAKRTPATSNTYRSYDPEFAHQWHLKFASSASLHAQKAWDSGALGDGVVVSIVDDGLQMTHPDLQEHFEADLSFDFNDNDPDVTPDPKIDDHGTSAAGACCAVNNRRSESDPPSDDFCGIGVAPNAHLSAIRLISRSTEDYQEAGGIGYKAADGNDVYSNSWGPPDDGQRLEGPGPLAYKAREQAMKVGRDGLGPIYVWAAGNGRPRGDNCNYDGWANHRYALTIGAVGSDLKQPYYSENCASMFAVAPSNGGDNNGIMTTDLLGSWGTSSGGCTTRFGGTSAAAPLAAGVVALVLSVNSKLGWRDVQGIFALSSEPIDTKDASWRKNGAGLQFSHKYGFGLVNAERAVNLARSWTKYGGVSTLTSGSMTHSTAIESEGSASVSWHCENAHVRVLHVDLTLSVTHPHRGDLRIQLRSPSGMLSDFQDVHGDTNADIRNWTYTSVANWHEAPHGDWNVMFENAKKSKGHITAWQITLHTVDK
jgi:proprotein convertase subtilisin/kexin type 7